MNHGMANWTVEEWILFLSAITSLIVSLITFFRSNSNHRRINKQSNRIHNLALKIPSICERCGKTETHERDYE